MSSSGPTTPTEAHDASDIKEEPIDPYLVTLDASEDPKRRYTLGRRWLIVLVVGSGAFCTTCASSIHSFAEFGVAREFGISREVSILGISLFIEGLGIGPLLVGPLSELYGRNVVYLVSYVLFFAFTFPVAFAQNACSCISMYGLRLS